MLKRRDIGIYFRREVVTNFTANYDFVGNVKYLTELCHAGLSIMDRQ